MGLTDLVQLTLDARLGVDLSNEAVVNTLYFDAAGFAPNPYQLAYYSGLLQAGQYTPAFFAILVKRAPENSVNINLVGLASSGFP